VIVAHWNVEPSMSCALLLVAHALLAVSPSQGAIEGTVVNASQDGRPAAGVEVVLRVRQDGQFVPLDATTSDEEGRFSFRDLPLGELYLPGANREDVHYPGARVLLDAEEPHAQVELVVYDTISHPSPLVAREHTIVLRPGPGKLEVTETILISNPSLHTYVSRVATGHMPITLRLGIPSDFKRVTFHKEFFGRRFHLVKGSLLTTIPWTPGEQQLAFTYILPVEEKDFVWERPTDMPCEKLRVRVVGKNPDEISCNLPALLSDGEQAVFVSHAELPAGQVVRVELNRLPGSFMATAKWVAVCLLAALIVAALVIAKRRSATRSASHLSASTPQKTARRRGTTRRGRSRSIRAPAARG
jgi:hypothetical protein